MTKAAPADIKIAADVRPASPADETGALEHHRRALTALDATTTETARKERIGLARGLFKQLLTHAELKEVIHLMQSPLLVKDNGDLQKYSAAVKTAIRRFRNAYAETVRRRRQEFDGSLRALARDGCLSVMTKLDLIATVVPGEVLGLTGAKTDPSETEIKKATLITLLQKARDIVGMLQEISQAELRPSFWEQCMDRDVMTVLLNRQEAHAFLQTFIVNTIRNGQLNHYHTFLRMALSFREAKQEALLVGIIADLKQQGVLREAFGALTDDLMSIGGLSMEKANEIRSAVLSRTLN